MNINVFILFFFSKMNFGFEVVNKVVTFVQDRISGLRLQKDDCVLALSDLP